MDKTTLLFGFRRIVPRSRSKLLFLLLSLIAIIDMGCRYNSVMRDYCSKKTQLVNLGAACIGIKAGFVIVVESFDQIRGEFNVASQTVSSFE